MTQYYESNSNRDKEGKDLVDDLIDGKHVTSPNAEKIIASKKAGIEEINITLNNKIKELDSKALGI